MLNGHDICHGGFIFTLADSAFAYSCNSYNLVTVASGCTIDFLAPARQGDVLRAQAHERSVSGRTGVYDIEVTNQRGEKIALFRGKSYRIKGHVVEGRVAARQNSGSRGRARERTAPSRTQHEEEPCPSSKPAPGDLEPIERASADGAAGAAARAPAAGR